jgi:hypothetical protein
MEWAKLCDWLLKDFQMQLVGPLLFMCHTYWKMDARQKVSDEKLSNVDDGLEVVKDDLRDVKKTLVTHSDDINDVKHKMELTKVELQNKWEKYTNEKSRIQETEIYTQAEIKAEGQRASQA